MHQAKVLSQAAQKTSSMVRANSVRVSAQAASTAAAPKVAAGIREEVAALFTPFKMGKFQLEHRMVLPPLTRTRGTEDNLADSVLSAEYYSQRATKGGLLIAEGTYINDTASGYPNVPGIWRPDQVEAWKPITAAVKAKGAVFFNQIWHTGRAAHPALIGGRTVVGASPIRISGQVYVGNGKMEEHVVPQPLDKAGIKQVVQDYANAAKNAIAAGFDGVEIHGANGYLIDQFIKSGTNQRTDEYGGSIENRARFVLEVVEAVVQAVGAERVGLRLSPFTDFLEATDATPFATFTYIVEQINKYPLAYLHMIEPRMQGNDVKEDAPGSLEPFRKVWHGPFITAGGFNAENGAHAVESGHADLVAYGRWWIANPDLPKRFQLGAPLNPYDRATFYVPGAKGYTDYPFLDDNQN